MNCFKNILSSTAGDFCHLTSKVLFINQEYLLGHGYFFHPNRFLHYVYNVTDVFLILVLDAFKSNINKETILDNSTQIYLRL